MTLGLGLGLHHKQGTSFAHTDDASLLALWVGGDWTTSGSEITTWNDSSGNGRDLTPVATGFTESGDTAVMNGTSTAMSVADFWYDNGGGTCFIALSASAGLAASEVLCGETSTASTTPLYLPFYVASGSTGAGRILIRNDASTNLLTEDPVTFDMEDAALQIYEVTDTGTQVTFKINGATTDTTATYARSGAITLTAFTLGALNRTSVTSYFSGTLHRVLVTGATDADTLTNHRNRIASDLGVSL